MLYGYKTVILLLSKSIRKYDDAKTFIYPAETVWHWTFIHELMIIWTNIDYAQWLYF